MILLGAADWLNTWLTPLWILGLGALVALVALVVIWLIVGVVARGGIPAVSRAVQEGPLLPIFWTVMAFASFGVLGFFLVRDTGEIVTSVTRSPFTGSSVKQFTIPASAEDEDPTPVPYAISFRPNEIRTIEIESNQQVNAISEIRGKDGEPLVNFEITAGESGTWDRGLLLNNPFETEGLDQLLFTNQSEDAASVTVKTMTAPLHPQARSVLITAAAIVLTFLLYMLIRWLFPKTAAIALATSKSEMASPLFMLLLILGFFLLGLFMYLPYHTFGEDIKVLKDSGLTLIMVFAIVHAVWAASTSVAEEIEGKTALTVLSKPIGRRQFILGKFLGISWSSAVLFILLGAWLLIVVSYKPIYDARETANTNPTWQVCHLEVVRTVPGLFLAYLETLVFAAIGVAISTRLPMLANIMICFVIYAFGHLTPLLVQGAGGQFENVQFVARFIATVLPVLDHFNIQAAVAAGVGVSYGYLMWATVYCALYCTIAMLLALILFEDRDLA
ncbi:MAG: ABC transporter permease subunit [Planctomycetota bacterium]